MTLADLGVLAIIVLVIYVFWFLSHIGARSAVLNGS